jgi:hypothetical protein
MYRAVLFLSIYVSLVGSAFAGIQITPTTTLTNETSSNTSAAGTFAGTSNGNVRASNVSKEPISSLLGTNDVKLLAHLMPWWGNAGHINVGYSSHDAAQVRRQINDMISRGFAGVIIAEGTSNSFNLASLQLVAEEVSRHPGFLFAIQVNKRPIVSASDPTAKLISDLKFASIEFFTSSNYLRVNGRPVVLFFDGEITGVDWSSVEASIADQPMFVFRNSSGFWHDASSGAFSWIGTSTSQDPSGLAHLDTFYKTAQSETSKLAIGSTWKGFDDSIASWSRNRKVPQRCGQTWLDTIARARNYLGAFPGEQVFLQVNTWNNYEEGTAIESGIDNCVSVAASISGSTLTWSVQGAPSGMNPEATIAKYLVYVSLDGQKLMQLTEKAVGDRTLNLASFGFDPGTYKLYVKAVGKPSIVNKVSGAVTYNVAASSTTQPQTSASGSDTTTQTSTSALTTTTTLSTTTTSSVSLRAGRVAVSADGNDHDRDDIGASPMELAMLAKAGSTAKSKLVHFEYNNHIWSNYSTAQKNDMTYSVMSAASRFGFSSSIFFSVIDNPTAAYNHLAAEINKSSSTNPLYILATGPMHTVCEAIKRSYSTRRPYVTVVSHSTWNETHSHNGSCTWSGIKTLGVKTIDIIDQNYPRFATNTYSDVSWLSTHPDANIRWVWSRMQISHIYFTAADVSDAGEMWYWLKNDQYGSFSKLKSYFGTTAFSTGTTTSSGSTSGSCSASGSTLTQAISNFENTCNVTYDKTKGHDCDPISSGYLCSTSSMN